MIDDFQARCERGQRQLIETDYLAAIATLHHVEADAWAACDWDTLSRLYMPLQEARRQARQRCGEGTIVLDLIVGGADARPRDAAELARRYPMGQLLVAGWGDIGLALRLRQMQQERRQYAETFLAAAYPIAGSDARAIVVTPLPGSPLPDAEPRSLDQLLRLLPPHAVVLHESELPPGEQPGTPALFAWTMALWERLHAPFLALADATADPVLRMQGYRTTLRVDPACELAHQKLSMTARELLRSKRAG